jgi:hypothetical protein
MEFETPMPDETEEGGGLPEEDGDDENGGDEGDEGGDGEQDA